MAADKRIASLTMIEWQPLLPAHLTMAGLAILAQAPKMLILFRMAGIAVRWGAPEIVSRVTGGARHFTMCAHQRIIGHMMVETCAVELHDTEATTFVIGMAHLAGLSRDLWCFAVIPIASRNVCANRFVAGQAFVVLCVA